MAGKFDLIFAGLALVARLLWIESGHRTELALPAVIKVADRCASADLSYAAGRLMFFDGGFVSGDRRRFVDRSAYPAECQ